MDTSDRNQLIAQLQRLHAELRSPKNIGAAPFMDLDLTIPQLKVVLLLADEGPMRMGPLAQELGISLSACTHLVDKLVRACLVSRGEDPDDRRVVRCTLTEDGVAIVERLRGWLPIDRPEFHDKLSMEELRVIVEAMTVFKRVMQDIQSESGGSPSGEAH